MLPAGVIVHFPVDGSGGRIKIVLSNIIQDLEPAGIGARDFKETIFIEKVLKKHKKEEMILEH